MKIKKKLFLLSHLILVLFISSCQIDDLEQRINELAEDVNNLQKVNSILELRNIINETKFSDVLMLELIDDSDIITLRFENGTNYEVSKEIVTDYQIDKNMWELSMQLSDSSNLTSFIVGELLVDENDIRLNPHNIAPLTSIIDVETKVKGKFMVKVHGQDGAKSDIILKPEEYGTEHSLEVYGLYADYINSVELIFTNKEGIERVSTIVPVKTKSLPQEIPGFDIVKPYDNYEQNTLILINYRNSHIPFMIDPYGKVRWYSEGFTITKKYALQKLKNGNIGFGRAGNGQGSVIEYTMMGELIKEYSFYPEFENAHHDVYEMANGNFLIAVNKVGIETIEDHIIELDRKTGDINNVWDLREILPMERYTLRKIKDGSDWFHVNAVIHDERDNTIIVSGQPQGTVKITWDNQLKWILAPHEGWGAEYSKYLLQPEGENFEWSWGQHAPLILPNGNLLQFDNGYGREYGKAETQYSRVVEYQISENENNEGGSISQVWQYGKQRGIEMFAPIISDVDYIEKSSSTFIVAGSTAFSLSYTDSLNNSLTTDIDKIETRIIEVNESKDVLFEMTINMDDKMGSTYRAEKLVLDQ